MPTEEVKKAASEATEGLKNAAGTGVNALSWAAQQVYVPKNLCFWLGLGALAVFAGVGVTAALAGKPVGAALGATAKAGITNAWDAVATIATGVKTAAAKVQFAAAAAPASTGHVAMTAAPAFGLV